MTQILKVKGQIDNASGRPIITAGGKSPFFLLDARRYKFADGEKIKSVEALGSLNIRNLIMKPVGSNEFIAEFSRKGLPHFSFTPEMGMCNVSYPSRKKPTTVVCVYRVNLEDWGKATPFTGRIYGIGRTIENKRIFAALSRLLIWSSNVLGTGHYYDTPTGDWCVAVHYFNGENSALIDRFGDLKNIKLEQETEGKDDVSIWASSVASNPQNGGVAYTAVYDEEMTEEDLLNLFYEAKNNFNLL